MWLRALPDEVIGRRPVLSVAYAWALLSIGELEDVERRLRDGERWLTATDGVPDEPGAGRPEMVVVDRREFATLPALIAVYRAVLAQIRGDVATTVRHAREALNLAPEDDDLLRGAAEALLGSGHMGERGPRDRASNLRRWDGAGAAVWQPL